MEKERNLKTRFMAGGLALFLAMGAGTYVALAKGEDQIVQEETQVELIERLKTDYEIINPEYTNLCTYKYVSDDGKIEKWYGGYLPEIDGLKRTEETYKPQYYDYTAEANPCDIQQEHGHLYYSDFYVLFKPGTCGDPIIYDGEGLRWFKMKSIVDSKDLEAGKILEGYGVYRLSDCLFTIQEILKMDYNKKGVIFLKPKNLSDGVLECEVVIFKDKTLEYTEEMNGYLIAENNNKFFVDKNNQKKKTLTFKLNDKSAK